MSDPVDDLLRPKFDSSLKHLIGDVNLTTLSRVSAARLEQSAIPNINRIEFVDSPKFLQAYNPLYLTNFHGHERERSAIIANRLAESFAGRRTHQSPFYVIGIRGKDGKAVGAAHFSILVPESETVIPYLQYIYIREENRSQLLSEVLHTIVLAVSLVHHTSGLRNSATNVPFTVCETRPGRPKAAVAAVDTMKVHAKSGSQALMLRSKLDGRLLSAHIQPGLEMHDPPTTLIWLLRGSPASDSDLNEDSLQSLGRALVAAYYKSLREDGVPERNVALAERVIEARYQRDCEFVQVPLSDVTADMYVGIDDCREL